MILIDYFSKDSHKRALFIFNLIAPIYKLVDKYLNESFSKAINILSEEVELQNKIILDIGTGTGAWASQFLLYQPQKIIAVDFSKKMIAIARNKKLGIDFQQMNANDLRKIQDNTFDIVTSSYVLHGMNKQERQEVLLEMKRVSKEYIVIHDFTSKTTPFIAILEFLERSDYPYFKNHFLKEMELLFTSVKKIEVENGAGLYIGKII